MTPLMPKSLAERLQDDLRLLREELAVDLVVAQPTDHRGGPRGPFWNSGIVSS